ncbi:unnamed protein product [Litomosoides sigmodontis]|uniref:Origin recognition complex subunit 1 n=1 Tax=Litomosoides sigmodontis TaxID=42156 RepID=A0A3P6UBN8_LITSI|nr:unnamed protein product [Litomosoides sigmodontis]
MVRGIAYLGSNLAGMYIDKDELWNEKSENTTSNSLIAKNEENKDTSNKRIMPKRKAKSIERRCFEDLFVLNSPPCKRSRSSVVLQQVKLTPAFSYGENLNSFGFENEDIDSEDDSEDVRSKVLHDPRISLPLPSTMTETPKLCKRRVSIDSKTHKSGKLSVWKQKIGSFGNGVHGNGFSLPKAFELKSTEALAGANFIDDAAGKNKLGKVSERVNKPIKKIDGLHLNGCRRPLITLTRTKVFDGARIINYEHNSFGHGLEDNDRPYSDSESEVNSDFCCRQDRKIKHRNSSLCENRQPSGDTKLILCIITLAQCCVHRAGTPYEYSLTWLVFSLMAVYNIILMSSNSEKKSDKYTTCGVISNVQPRETFPTQRLETLEAIYCRLHTSEIPQRLPCREAEFERVCAFIKGCTANNAISQAMYVSGVPGTGKTATVLQAVRHMKASENLIFDFVTVNAMELSDPKQIFVKIYQDLFNVKKKTAPKKARKKLNDIFRYRDKKRLPVIVLVDELDLLSTKKQEIIYDIFNWSTNEESLVSVIAIANTLDLPERLFSQRISSRLGANRLCFQPYDHDEVAYIIRDRLLGSTAVEAEAVELASRKVAAISGDLRKALDILRSAAELAISANQKQLTMKNVQEAIRLASTSVRVELIRALPRHSALLLRAALAEQLSSGLDEFQFHILFKQYRLQCSVANINPMSTSAAYRNAMEMCSERLLVAASGTGSMSRRFRLGMTTHDVQFAFKQVDESIF